MPSRTISWRDRNIRDVSLPIAIIVLRESTVDQTISLRWSYDGRVDRSTTSAAGHDKLFPPSYREREHSNTLAGLIDLSAPDSLEAAPVERSGDEAIKSEEQIHPVRVATSTASS